MLATRGKLLVLRGPELRARLRPRRDSRDSGRAPVRGARLVRGWGALFVQRGRRDLRRTRQRLRRPGRRGVCRRARRLLAQRRPLRSVWHELSRGHGHRARARVWWRPFRAALRALLPRCARRDSARRCARWRSRHRLGLRVRRHERARSAGARGRRGRVARPQLRWRRRGGGRELLRGGGWR